MERILLASGSPRRRELLAAAGIPFDSLVPDIDEAARDALPPSDRVLALAEDKARAASVRASASSPRLVLGADTLVCLPDGGAGGGELALGKPEGIDGARDMMRRLEGRTHVVRSGLALLDRESGALFSIRSDTRVRFAPLGAGEIEAYLASGEWEGVAGAYRIQGLAAFIVDRLEGSWTGVVGLPMRELYVILQQAGYRVPSLWAGEKG
jgi:septum formation protein